MSYNFFSKHKILKAKQNLKCVIVSYLLHDICGIAMNVIAIIYTCLESLEDEVNSKSAKDRRSAELSFLVSSTTGTHGKVLLGLEPDQFSHSHPGDFLTRVKILKNMSKSEPFCNWLQLT